MEHAPIARPRVPKYCTGCGRALVRVEAGARFDHDDGHRIVEYQYRCPKWLWSIFSSHTRYFISEC